MRTRMPLRDRRKKRQARNRMKMGRSIMSKRRGGGWLGGEDVDGEEGRR